MLLFQLPATVYAAEDVMTKMRAFDGVTRAAPAFVKKLRSVSFTLPLEATLHGRMDAAHQQSYVIIAFSRFKRGDLVEPIQYVFNGQPVHLNGDEALAVARTRNAYGGYGAMKIGLRESENF